MRSINTSRLSPDECTGIQLMGLQHCQAIQCKWQGLTACQGQHILATGKNNKGFTIGPHGLAEEIDNTPVNQTNQQNKNK